MQKSAKYLCLCCLIVATLSTQAKNIIVDTVDNLSTTPGRTNLVQAISRLQDGDTIQFNIPGAPGTVFYLVTPPGGYPIITNNNITIDGYSQPGASPNTNSIHAPNNAKIRICLDSRNANATDMGNIENLSSDPNQKFGYGHDEWAVIGVFKGTNFNIRGIGILAAPANPAANNGGGALIKSIAFGRDYDGSAENWHVNGCWIGVDPADGQLKYITDNSTFTNIASPAIAISSYRHRDSSGANPVYPQPGIIGVAANSTNPRAEFNVICNGYGFDSEGLNYRISGNFWGVLPDGMTSADFSVLLDGAQMGDGFVEIGRDDSNCVIGTDGDGANDADEGNVFGGFANGAVMINFYSSPQTNIIIAGNTFGIAIDGQTRFTNTATIVDGFGGQATAQFGSDFDGTSDDLEANTVYNNNPFSTLFPDPTTTPEPKFFELSTGARVSFRGNKLINNGLVPFTSADGSGSLQVPFSNYEAPYMDVSSNLVPVLDLTNSAYPHLKGVFAVGVDPYTNIIIDVYQLDPEGWQNGKKFEYSELGFPNETNGFPQGSKYLASFSVTNSGVFDINLTGVNLGSGTLTVTANYSADPPATHRGRVQTSNFSNPITLASATPAPVPLKITLSGTNIVLGWPTSAGPNATLQTTSKLNPASWGNLSAPPPTVVGSEYQTTVPISGNEAFYRLSQ